MLVEKLRIELSNAYRQFGDSETDIKENVETWIRRLTDNEEEMSTIELVDGTKLKGVDIYVAVRVASREEFTGDETTIEDDKITHHAEACVMLATKEDIVLLKHTYDIVDDNKDPNLYTNHKFKKADLTDFNGDFITIWP